MESPLQNRSNRLILLVFLAVTLYASYSLVEPFLRPIVLALLIGMLAFPAQDRLTSKLNGRKNTAALISTLVLALVFLIPA